MKKLLLICTFSVAGLVSAKGFNNEVNNVEKSNIFKRYLITIKTVCGTTYQTVFDTDFDSEDCLYNEWEMYNDQDCGHYSYENPMT